MLDRIELPVDLRALPETDLRQLASELRQETIDTVAVTDYPAATALLQRQLVGTMQAISQGATLRASGIASVCQYCDVRGLCRKGAW